MESESSAAVLEQAEAPSTEAQPSVATEQAGDQPQPTDWRARIKEDPELAKVIQEEANRIFQKSRDRERRAQAKKLAQEVDTAPDTETRAAKAAELAKIVATEEDPEERDNAEFLTKARTAETAIARLRNTDEYADVWNKHGKAEMDRRWHQDPEAFADWIWEQVTDLRAERRARGKADTLSEAKATDIVNQRLRNLPTPMTGATGPNVNGMTLDRLLSLPHAERAKWKTEHKGEYDELVAALATT